MAPPESLDLRAETAFPTCLWDEAGATALTMKGKGGP